MRKIALKIDKANKRATRTRVRLKGQDNGRLRLSVHRTGQHIYAQVIDDTKGVTVAAASTQEKETKGKGKSGGNTGAAAIVGKAVAERALKAGVTEVAFDKGSFRFHGRVKALADAAREAGLKF